MDVTFFTSNNLLNNQFIKKLSYNNYYSFLVCDHIVSFFKDEAFTNNLEFTLQVYNTNVNKTLLESFFNKQYKNEPFTNQELYSSYIEKINIQKGYIYFFNINTEKTKRFPILSPRSSDIKDNIYFSEILKEHANDIIPQNRKLSINHIGLKAKSFLEKKVVIKNFIDYNTNIFPGIGTEFMVDSNYYEAGYGRAYSINAAKYLSYLEAVERYSSVFYPYKNTEIYDSFNNLNNAINPEKFILPTSYKNKFKSYSHNLKIYWTQAESLKKESTVLIPEQLAVYGDSFFRDKNKQNRFIYDSSNGVALGGSYEEAIITAIFELIERDNFLTTWFGYMKPNKLYTSNLSNSVKNLIYYIEKQGYTVDIYDITMELKIPCYWILIRDFNNHAYMFSYNSAACHINIDKAIKNALLEAIVGINVHAENNKKNGVANIREVTLFEDHVQYYNQKTKNHIYDDVTSPKYANIDYANSSNMTYKDLINSILEQYEDIYIVNLTSKKMAHHSLYCVKVIIPGMLPMTFGSQNERISISRINNERRRKNKYTLNTINTFPHPFP